MGVCVNHGTQCGNPQKICAVPREGGAGGIGNLGVESRRAGLAPGIYGSGAITAAVKLTGPQPADSPGPAVISLIYCAGGIIKLDAQSGAKPCLLTEKKKNGGKFKIKYINN